MEHDDALPVAPTPARPDEQPEGEVLYLAPVTLVVNDDNQLVALWPEGQTVSLIERGALEILIDTLNGHKECERSLHDRIADVEAHLVDVLQLFRGSDRVSDEVKAAREVVGLDEQGN